QLSLFSIVLLLVTFTSFFVKAQTIETVAGTGILYHHPDGLLGTEAQLGLLVSVVIDTEGNHYYASASTHKVFKKDVSGLITTVAGTGTIGYNGDGIAATAARLNSPSGIALDGSGNPYI